ncbi:MAG: hypothetical protein ACRC68_12835, partial [Clostridium sp.]
KPEVKVPEVNKEVVKEPQVNIELPKETQVEEEYFNIYTANIDSYKKEVKIKKSIPIIVGENQREYKLKNIVYSLSKNCFSMVPIEFVKIENINGKDIAIINLKELKENEGIVDYDKLKVKDKTWKWGFMQGSTGGQVTTVSLEETILQRDYKGTWIDGVKFLYNNEKIEQQHAPRLSDIIYR